MTSPVELEYHFSGKEDARKFFCVYENLPQPFHDDRNAIPAVYSENNPSKTVLSSSSARGLIILIQNEKIKMHC